MITCFSQKKKNGWELIYFETRYTTPLAPVNLLYGDYEKQTQIFKLGGNRVKQQSFFMVPPKAI